MKKRFGRAKTDTPSMKTILVERRKTYFYMVEERKTYVIRTKDKSIGLMQELH